MTGFVFSTLYFVPCVCVCFFGILCCVKPFALKVNNVLFYVSVAVILHVEQGCIKCDDNVVSDNVVSTV